MKVYNTYAEFGTHGTDPIHPSAYQVIRNCEICLEPLYLVKNTTNGGDNNHTRLHAAVRIKACGHMHGTECLKTWLEIGNTCPTCNRMLFLPAMEQPLSQEDVEALMRELQGIYSEDQIMRSLARYMHVSDAATTKAKQILATKVIMEEAKEKEKEEKEREEFMLEDEDFLDSDVEVGAEDEDNDDDAYFLDGWEDKDDASEEDFSIVSDE